jgi:hypothetical protein
LPYRCPDGATVSFEEVSAEDDVDGSVDVSCNHNSGEIFPIGEAVVTCTAEESFTITVQDTIAPVVQITKAVDKKSVEISDGGTTTNSRYIKITFEATEGDIGAISSITCILDGQYLFSSKSPVVYDKLSKGTHKFTVRAWDAVGTRSGADEFTWTIGKSRSPR